MEYLKYLDKLISSIGLTIANDGKLVNRLYHLETTKFEDGESSTNYIEHNIELKTPKDQLLLFYPSQDNIKNKLTDKSNPRDPKILGLPFNPIIESSIGHEYASHSVLRSQIRAYLRYGFKLAGEYIIRYLLEKPNIPNIPQYLLNFFMEMGEVFSTRVKDISTDSTLKKWKELVEKDVQGGDKLFVLTLQRQDGDKWFKKCNITSPLMKAILDMPIPQQGKTLEVNGIKLGKKEVTVFKGIFKALLPDLNNTDCVYSVSSEDIEVGVYKATMGLYLKLTDRIDSLCRIFSTHLGEDVHKYYNPRRDILTQEEVDSVNNLLKELTYYIPSESDILSNPSEATGDKPVEPVVQDARVDVVRQAPSVQPRVQEGRPQPRAMSEDDIINSIIDGTQNRGYLVGERQQPPSIFTDPDLVLNQMPPRQPMGPMVNDPYDPPSYYRQEPMGHYNHMQPSYNRFDEYLRNPMGPMDHRGGMYSNGYNNGYGYRPNGVKLGGAFH